MGNRSDEYEIHRCCVMCAAVYSELLRRSCEGVCSGKGGETKELKITKEESEVVQACHVSD